MSAQRCVTHLLDDKDFPLHIFIPLTELSFELSLHLLCENKWVKALVSLAGRVPLISVVCQAESGLKYNK